MLRYVCLIALLFFGQIGKAGELNRGEPVEVNVDLNKVTNVMRGGIGASWHAIEKPIPIGHGGSGWGAYPPADDERAWQQIYRHAGWLGLDWNRVEIEQRIYEPERGHFTFDSPEMRILYRILDWNQQHGADVFFQQFQRSRGKPHGVRMKRQIALLREMEKPDQVDRIALEHVGACDVDAIIVDDEILGAGKFLAARCRAPRRHHAA